MPQTARICDDFSWVLPKKSSNGVLVYDDKGFLSSFQTLQWMEEANVRGRRRASDVPNLAGQNDRRLRLDSISLQSLFFALPKFFETL